MWLCTFTVAIFFSWWSHILNCARERFYQELNVSYRSISVCFIVGSLLPIERTSIKSLIHVVDVIRSNRKTISRIRGHIIAVYLQTSGRLDHFRHHHDVNCWNLARASVTLRSVTNAQTTATSAFGNVVPKSIAQTKECSYHLSELLILVDHLSDVLWVYRRNQVLVLQ